MEKNELLNILIIIPTNILVNNKNYWDNALYHKTIEKKKLIIFSRAFSYILIRIFFPQLLKTTLVVNIRSSNKQLSNLIGSKTAKIYDIKNNFLVKQYFIVC